MKTLTEKQAWKVIAVMFTSAPGGMCSAIGRLQNERLLAGPTAERMFDQIDRAIKKAGVRGGYLYDPRVRGDYDPNRVGFARTRAARARSK